MKQEVGGRRESSGEAIGNMYKQYHIRCNGGEAYGRTETGI